MKNKSFKAKCKALAVGIALILIPSTSFAGQWTGFYPVYEVYTHSAGYIFLKLNPVSAHINPFDCISTTHMRVNADQKNAQEIYQMALTAQAAGLKISAYVTGCDGNYPDARYLRIRN